MDRKRVTAELKLNSSIPAHLCKDSSVLCGRRRKDGSCNLLDCGYNVDTATLPHKEKVLLSEAYRKVRRK